MNARRPRFEPFGLLARGLLWLLGIGLLALLVTNGLTARLDDALYDLHLRHWGYPPGDDVVIVAIDPKSLDALGRWPWPRAMHAQLLDRLTAAGVRGVGMDVTVSEADADHPENDQLLAQAIKRNGRVVMPVFAEPAELGGPPQEILPLPAIAQNAAALGQVDVEEGTVRGAYLKAGLGQPYWPLLALAVYRLDDDPRAAKRLPGLRNLSLDRSPYLWQRDNYVLLRYAGSGGSFGRVSYVDVLRGDVPASLLKNRWVLVGATAEGMGDAIVTPDGSMPGVEYQANVLESLRRRIALTPLDVSAQMLLGAGMLALPLLLHRGRGWRNFGVAAASLLLPPLSSLLLLRIGMLWLPPCGTTLLIGAGWLGWGAFAWQQRRGLARPAAAGPA